MGGGTRAQIHNEINEKFTILTELTGRERLVRLTTNLCSMRVAVGSQVSQLIIAMAAVNLSHHSSYVL